MGAEEYNTMLNILNGTSMLEDNEDFIFIKETHPHIDSRLKLLWGTKECYALFETLFLDTRDGARKGFPRTSASAIYKLHELHDTHFPQFMKKSDIWTNQR